MGEYAVQEVHLHAIYGSESCYTLTDPRNAKFPLTSTSMLVKLYLITLPVFFAIDMLWL